MKGRRIIITKNEKNEERKNMNSHTYQGGKWWNLDKVRKFIKVDFIYVCIMYNTRSLTFLLLLFLLIFYFIIFTSFIYLFKFIYFKFI